MIYQLGWATLPGLRGISCSEFRAEPVETPDSSSSVAVEIPSDVDRDRFLRQLEEYFATRRFTNAADAFDTVKAYAMELAVKKNY